MRQVTINATDLNGKAGDSLFVPVLYISLSADNADGLVTFLMRLELLQAVSLARDPNMTASSATTWSTFRFGKVDEHSYGKKVQSILVIMLQNFRDDFLLVNPVVWLPRDGRESIIGRAVIEDCFTAADHQITSIRSPVRNRQLFFF